MRILGLDISTGIVGWCVLDTLDASFVELGHIDLRKTKDFWQKVDVAIIALHDCVKQHNVTKVFIEESLQRFRSGFSSAHTLSTLAKMNGLLSYAARNLVHSDPVYFSAVSARKQCGITIIRKSSLTAKQQTFNWVTQNLNKTWTMTRMNNVQVYCYDQADAYVIALAGLASLASVD